MGLVTGYIRTQGHFKAVNPPPDMSFRDFQACRILRFPSRLAVLLGLLQENQLMAQKLPAIVPLKAESSCFFLSTGTLIIILFRHVCVTVMLFSRHQEYKPGLAS